MKTSEILKKIAQATGARQEDIYIFETYPIYGLKEQTRVEYTLENSNDNEVKEIDL